MPVVRRCPARPGARRSVATADRQAALALDGETDLRGCSEVETMLANEHLQADQQRYRDWIGIYNQRLADRVGLHLARGGGFEPPPTP